MLQNSGEPDLDVLPTMLIYSPEGDLIETAVRVDLDLQGKGNDGLELLLIRSVETRRHTEWRCKYLRYDATPP